MTRAEILARARSQMGRRVEYLIGHGGSFPNLKSVGPRCDCSGFVAWCVGSPRRVPDTIGWIETSRIVKDTMGDRRLFVPAYHPEPGDLVVYGDWVDRTGKRRQGHVGILSEVPVDQVAPDWWARLKVVHCSLGNYRRTKDAIQETDALGFRGRSIFARWVGA